MANPQTENGFLRIANEIWNEVIRRDFSKRQKDIILFIWRLSYGCKKKHAFIPQLKDFELCGIGQQNIRKELEYLVSSRVIHWDEDGHIYSVNKDYERWQISPVKGWDKEKFKQLLHQNINHRTSQNEKSKPTVKVVFASQNKKLRLLKLRSNGFLKQEVIGLEIPCGCKVERVSKDSIKDIFKDITTAKEGNDTDPKSLTEAYSLVFGGGTMPPIFSRFLVPVMGKFGEKYAIELIMESGESAKNPSLRHIQSIHDGWTTRGIRSRKQAKGEKYGDQSSSQNRNQKQMNDLEELIRREREQHAVGSSG